MQRYRQVASTRETVMRHAETLAALAEVGAHASLDLLQQAKRALFGDQRVPVDRVNRFKLMRTSSQGHPDFMGVNGILDGLDSEFCKDPDHLEDVLDKVAAEHKLYPVDAE